MSPGLTPCRDCWSSGVGPGGSDTHARDRSHALRRIPQARRHRPGRADRQTRGQPRRGAGDRHRAGRAGQPRHQRHRAQAVRARAQGDRGGAPRRTAGGRALPHQGPRVPRQGRARPPRQQPVQGLRRRPRQRLPGALPEGGPRHLRPHLDARVRPQPHHRGAPLRADPQPLEPRALAGRLLGRRGGSR